MRAPIPHYAKGDMTAARARLSELTRLEGKQPGRPQVPTHLKKILWSSIILTEKEFSELKARAEYEGCYRATLVRNAIALYLRIHRDHL